ncbi:MAG: hypothetical protein M3292_00280 [Actinomycetota bacterium]|nr:hypothetical protein [Actinomycetota bacterium]
MSVPKSFWWAVGSVVAMVIGAFGPWAKVLFITIDGTDGGRDGWLVVAAAGVAGLVLLWYLRARRAWLLVVPLLAGIAGAATAIYDINDINSFTSSTLGVASSALSGGSTWRSLARLASRSLRSPSL